MADAAEESIALVEKSAKPSLFKKRWRAWLRAIHRDFGYLAIGFTIIYAVSGIAMNHVDDWDPSFDARERVVTITPVADEASDDDAAAQVAKAAGTGTPTEVFRAGDEVRLTYDTGTTVTAIGDTVTIQERDERFFFRVAVWLHAARGKDAWRYISDVYAVLLLYLAISGLFMIKGKLGLRWRGMILTAAGVAVPIIYLVLSGGPGAKPEPKTAATDGSGIRRLDPSENVE
jgi:hypothetical protein